MTQLYPSVYSVPHAGLPSNSRETATLQDQIGTEHIISMTFISSAPPTAPPSIEVLNVSGDTGAVSTVEGTTLRVSEHNVFLSAVMGNLPKYYIGVDASKPWLMYWPMHSLDLLSIAVDQTIRDRQVYHFSPLQRANSVGRAVSTLIHYLHPQGGFSGGAANTQIPHLVPTYPATSALAVVGSAQPGGGWDQLAANRQVTYDFFMRCKRSDGGFTVCEGGEVDIRGTYCLLVVATLLDLLTPELLHNVDKFITGCQTYEGGFACSSHAFSESEVAMAEAHGGYASCALLAHFFLVSAKPRTPTPSLEPGFPSKINVDSALRWSTLMQGEAIEGGAFRGRTNKLVDGCYSWWVGGGFPVLEEMARRELSEKTGKEEKLQPLFNTTALQEYTLIAAQREAGTGGGLRDKPSKPADLYHTCNNLSGFSLAQHHMIHSPSLVAQNRAEFDPSKGFPAVKPTTTGGGWKSEAERHDVRREVWANALGWVEDGPEHVVGGKANRVNATTPVFNILGTRLRPFINYFYGQTG